MPTYIVDYLKVECGGQCARCGKGFKLANAHIVPWAETLSHHHHNLIRLCPGCHDEYDATHLIARAEMQALKQGLIARLRSRLTSPLLAGLGTRAPNPTSRFLGRDHELGRLVGAVRAAGDGKGGAWLVAGESGVGKSRLLEEVRVRALVEGLVVVRGQAMSDGGAPYHLWRDVVSDLVLRAEIPDTDARILTAVVPDVGALIGRTVGDQRPTPILRCPAHH